MGLSLNMQTLTHEVSRARRSRRDALRAIDDSVSAQLTDARGRLADGRNIRSEDCRRRGQARSGWRVGLTREEGRRRSTVRLLLAQDARGRSEQASEQRRTLASARRELTKLEARRRQVMEEVLQALADERRQARLAWAGLGIGAPPRPSNGAAATDVRPSVSPTEPALRAPETENMGPQPSGAPDGARARLRDQVFEFVANHPDGARLAEVEKEVGLNRFDAIRVMSELIEDGKVAKRELLYYAI